MLPVDTTTIPADGQAFFQLIESYLTAEEVARVHEAFELARRAHGNELRKSGEPFFTHPLTVAYYLAEYRLDAPALVAALLHDVVEDTRISADDLLTQFGADVSRVVDGVTKLERSSNGNGPLSPEEQQSHTLHKLFDAMTDDVRVVLVKLFDRLHNMRTIDSMPYNKQSKKARETLSVYAPLANRLGMWALKSELQHHSIRVLERNAFHIIQNKIEQNALEQQALFASISSEIAGCLTENGVPFSDIQLHPQDAFTELLAFRRKYSTSSDPRSYDVDRTLRIVVLLEDIPSCYLALGYVHQLWRPVHNAIDDYIAAPRDNLYRALHTTVMHTGGQHVKIRFRTRTMEIMASIGILARWAYKDTPLWTQGVAERVAGLARIIKENVNLEPHNPAIGVQGVVEDVFSNQIIVYTPNGDARELPQGATAIDFGYAIHTEIGHQCRAAYVNGVLTPLNRPLNDGERVFIVKRVRPRPDRNWLDEDLGFVKTSRARTRIRRWFRRLPDHKAVAEGAQLLQHELEMVGLPDYPHQYLAELFGYEHAEELYFALGHAEQLTTTLATRLLEVYWLQGPRRQVGSVVQTQSGEKFLITQAGDRPLRLCHICRPRPGDTIVGYVRSSNAVTVHKLGCYALPPDPLSTRMLKLGWASDKEREVRLNKVEINGYDRAGLMFEVLELIQDERVNMTSVHARGSGNEALIHLEVLVNSPRQMVRILHRMISLVNVYAVQLLHEAESEEPAG